MQHKTTLLIWRAVILVTFLAAWEVAGRLFTSVQFSLARPALVAASIVDLCSGGTVVNHIFFTGGAALAGMILGTLIGAALGLLTWFSRSTATVLRPFVIALGALPILAVAPM